MKAGASSPRPPRPIAATKTGGIGPDDRVAVFDLTSNPPKVVQNLNAGLGATQVRVSPDGTLALIANRTEGTVSVFSVKDKRLTVRSARSIPATPKSLPSAVVFVDDKTALLTRGGDNMVSVLHIDGTNVTIDPRPITTGIGAYTMDINAAHTLAAVSNMGRGDGDEDSVSLIDLKSKPYRTVGTFGVPSGPEPLKFSPDGRYLAIGAQNGSTKPAIHPFHHDNGLLGLYAVEGQTLRKVAASADRRLGRGGGIFPRRQDRAGAKHAGPHGRGVPLGRQDADARQEHCQSRAPALSSFATAWP